MRQSLCEDELETTSRKKTRGRKRKRAILNLSSNAHKHKIVSKKRGRPRKQTIVNNTNKTNEIIAQNEQRPELTNNIKLNVEKEVDSHLSDGHGVGLSRSTRERKPVHRLGYL